jgi:NADH-quinone oxidoreductase subunit M
MGLLSVAIWLPVVVGALLLATGRDEHAGVVRWVALLGAIAAFLVTLPLIGGFDNGSAALQFQENLPWIERFNVRYHLGVDGISVWFVLLTAFITVVVVIAGWEVITDRVNQYMGAFLILSGLMVGVFAAADGLLFYVFFEATLIPMYIIIGVWGGPRRVYAAFKFFLYTLLGSLLMLIALIYLYYKSGGSFDIATWHKLPLPMNAQTLLFFAFFAAFSVKVPMWPVHTWLPDAHVEAPTGGSVVLAAIMLKLGAYGFLRFSMPIAPDAAREYDWFIISLSLIAVVYIGLVALVQQDMKKLVAYSSIAHMGFVTLGFFIFNELGVAGGIVQMISHVPVHRCPVRPDAQPRDCRLRRCRQHHAQVCGLRSAVRDGQLRPAGNGRFCRRVDGDPGFREVQLLDRRAGFDDADLRRRLHAVDGQARVFRRCRERTRP